MMTQYCHKYLDAQSDMLNTKFNLSTSYKLYIIMFVWLGFTFLFIPFLYYLYFNILNETNFNLAFFIFLLWLMWDLYPICMTDNGYKLHNILMNLFDAIYAGPLWVYISLYVFKNYYNIINNSVPIILALGLLNIFLMLLFFYNWFIYNREFINNNWLVKLGDEMRWKKYIKYVEF